MPNPMGKIKQSGDVHLPDVEQDDLDAQAATPDEPTWTAERTESGRPAAGVRRAGTLNDADDERQGRTGGDAPEASQEPPAGGKSGQAQRASAHMEPLERGRRSERSLSMQPSRAPWTAVGLAALAGLLMARAIRH